MAVYRYRENDFRPYVFLTNDFGASWRLLTDGTNGIPEDHPVRVVREDPDREGLLYAGTEFGIFVSFDEGAHWQSFQQNLPASPIADLKVHRQDLAIATHGRSFWILDDLTPLHAMRDAIREEALHLFQPREATLARFRSTGGDRAPENPANGVVLNYWVADEVTGDVKISVLDDTGTLIRVFEGPLDRKVSGPADDGGGEEGLKEGRDPEEVFSSREEGESRDPAAEEAGLGEEPQEDDALRDPNLEKEDLQVRRGMNRFVWNLQYPGPDVIPTAEFSLANTGGLNAPPGTYTLRVEAGGEVGEVEVRVALDPRIPTVSRNDVEAQFRLARKVRDRLTEVHSAIREVRSIREQSGEVLGMLREDEERAHLVQELEEIWNPLREELEAVEEALIQTRNESGQDPINFPSMLDDQLAYLYSHVNSSYGRPTEGAYQRYEDMVEVTDPYLERVDGEILEQVGAFNEVLRQAGVGPVVTKGS